MSGHMVIHRGPGVSQKAQVFNAHIASIRRWRIAEHRELLAKALFEGRRRVWVTEEAARGGKRRSLIDDNPASG
jgi:hypothetical protein